jgi:predicted Zn-dependent protease
LDVPEKRRTLVHATLHALGLWIHSDQPDDLLARSGIAQRMSLRDIQTLRCLYNAPPYGDGVVE